VAQTIKIKRSTGSAAPTTIAAGELAYSKGSATLYIGDPDTNNANTPLPIGPAIINNAGTLSLASGATALKVQQAIDTEVGVDVQAYDAGLADIAGLAVTDGNFIVGNGTNWVVESGATARTSLGLGSLATLSEVGATEITDNSVGAAELNVSGNGTVGQALVSDGDGTFSWSTISVVDNDVSVANLITRLGQISSAVTIGDATDVTVTTSGNLTVTGDLTVSGTTTTVNSETIDLADNIINLNSNLGSGTAPTQDAGIRINRGSATDQFLVWNETNDYWQFGPVGGPFTRVGEVVSVSGGSAVTASTASGAVSLGLDFSLLTDMTGDIAGTTEFILQDGTTESRKAASEIKLSAFNNDSGFTSNAGTLTGITINSTDGSISGTGTASSGSPTFDLEVATIDGGTY
jgi:hypothetical protein